MAPKDYYYVRIIAWKKTDFSFKWSNKGWHAVKLTNHELLFFSLFPLMLSSNNFSFFHFRSRGSPLVILYRERAEQLRQDLESHETKLNDYKEQVRFSLPFLSSLPHPPRGCPRGVMVKAMDCRIVVHEFILQSCYYVHFQANTLEKGMNPLILPAMG